MIKQPRYFWSDLMSYVFARMSRLALNWLAVGACSPRPELLPRSQLLTRKNARLHGGYGLLCKRMGDALRRNGPPVGALCLTKDVP